MPCRINVFSGRKVATRKPAKRWFCRVFAWRPFASPGKDTTNSSPTRNAWSVAYFRVAGRKVAMRKHEKVIIWRVFAWRPFAFSPLFVVSSPGGANGRHAKTRQMVILAGFLAATFCQARQITKRRRMKNVVLSCGGAKDRHAKTRKSHHLAGFRVAPFRLFAPKTR